MEKYTVISKYNGYLSITETNSGIRHIWPRKGDTLELTLEQLKSILNIPGGRKILENRVAIENQDVVEELGLDVEPEYYYTADTIKDLLTNGTNEQLAETLDFAPEGTNELIADMAVEMRLSDRNKIATISNKTGKNITSQIDIIETSDAPEEESQKRRSGSPFKTAEEAIKTSADAPKKRGRKKKTDVEIAE